MSISDEDIGEFHMKVLVKTPCLYKDVGYAWGEAGSHRLRGGRAHGGGTTGVARVRSLINKQVEVETKKGEEDDKDNVNN